MGILATMTYFTIANLLIWLGSMSAEIASVLAYLAGMVVSFFGQKIVTFQGPNDTRRQLWRFAVLSSAGFAISYYSVVLAAQVLGVAALWGTVVTSISIPLLSFVAMKRWVFAARS